MSTNRGKQFEDVIRDAFKEVPDTSVYRLYDTMGGFSSVANVSDYIIYHYPYQYFVECKAIHKNTLSINSNDPKRKYGMISNTQWEGMLELSKIKGVYAGVICWWVDVDITRWLPIQVLDNLRNEGLKSIRYDTEADGIFSIDGQKKRVFFSYDMNRFFEDVVQNEKVKWKLIDGHTYCSCDGGKTWMYVYPKDRF